MDSNTGSISKFGIYEKSSHEIPPGTDLNTLIDAGIYVGYDLLNEPDNLPNDSTFLHIEVIRYSDIWTVQKAYPFTDAACPVFIRTQTEGIWNAWRLFNPGTANTAQVLAGYTFSSANGVNLSGSMPSYTSGSQSVTTSGKWGFDTTYGAWLYIPTNGYYTTSHWLNIPWNTIKSKLTINSIDWVGLSSGVIDPYGPNINYISGVVPGNVSGNVIVIGFSSVDDPNTPTPTSMTIDGVSQPLWRSSNNGGVGIGVARPGSTVVLYGTSQRGPQYMYIHYGVPK